MISDVTEFKTLTPEQVEAFSKAVSPAISLVTDHPWATMSMVVAFLTGYALGAQVE